MPDRDENPQTRETGPKRKKDVTFTEPPMPGTWDRSDTQPADEAVPPGYPNPNP